MNSYMKWLYEFIYMWIHVWNEYMNSWVYEFMWMNSNIRIHKYMNSDIRIHCIQSEFMNLISLTWIHDMNSLLKIDENSIFWIHDIEFSSEIWHMKSLKWIQKNHDSDFCYEFIHDMNIYEFTNLISWEILWFCIKSTL